MKVYVENQDGSVNWTLVEGETTHSGFIKNGQTRAYLKNGMASVDNDGVETGEFEQVPVVVNVWQEMLDQEIAGEISIQWFSTAEKATAAAELAALQNQTVIDNAYCAQIKNIVGSISPSEMASWPKQEAQALAWQADNMANVPFIQNLATQRNITLGELVGRILQKAAIYEDLSSKALGQKHAAEDAL